MRKKYIKRTLIALALASASTAVFASTVGGNLHIQNNSTYDMVMNGSPSVHQVQNDWVNNLNAKPTIGPNDGVNAHIEFIWQSPITNTQKDIATVAYTVSCANGVDTIKYTAQVEDWSALSHSNGNNGANIYVQEDGYHCVTVQPSSGTVGWAHDGTVTTTVNNL